MFAKRTTSTCHGTRSQRLGGKRTAAIGDFALTTSTHRLLAIYPLTAIAMSATIAPKIEVYTLLACSVHRPDILRHMISKNGHLFDTPRALSDVLENEPVTLQTESTDGLAALVVPGLRKNDTNAPDKPATCAADPVVQAAVAKLSASESASACHTFF